MAKHLEEISDIDGWYQTEILKRQSELINLINEEIKLNDELREMQTKFDKLKDETQKLGFGTYYSFRDYTHIHFEYI